MTTNASGGTYGIGFAGRYERGLHPDRCQRRHRDHHDRHDDRCRNDAAIKTVTTSLATLGTQSKSVGRQMTYVGKLQDATEAGIGNLWTPTWPRKAPA